MHQGTQIARRMTLADYRELYGIPRRSIAQGTPVDLKLFFWGGSLLLLAAYLLGGGEPDRPLRRRKASASGGSVAADAISALENLGYSRGQARKGVTAAKQSGARGFDEIMRQAMQVLG